MSALSLKRWFRIVGSLPTMMANDIAIDLGTANTLIYMKGRGIVLNEPSVVAVEARSRRCVAVGSEAKQMLGRTPADLEAIRPLKDGVIADFQVSEEMLRQFILKVLHHRRFIKPSIVIAVPSGITEVEKRAVKDSAEHAGCRDLHLIAEPIAAAIGVGLPVNAACGNMVVDIGGGTTEIAVIALSGIVTQQSIRVAGDEMDEAVVQYLRKNYNMAIGQQTSELIKMTVGSAYPMKEEKDMEISGRDLVAGIPRTIRINSAEIREALSEPITAIVEGVRRTLERTPPELSADIVERGIVMTGGGALLKGLDMRLSKETSLTVTVADDPLSCVVLGSGKVLEEPEEYAKVLMEPPRG
jgi:rod shape-determining protein MreB